MEDILVAVVAVAVDTLVVVDNPVEVADVLVAVAGNLLGAEGMSVAVVDNLLEVVGMSVAAVDSLLAVEPVEFLITSVGARQLFPVVDGLRISIARRR